MTALPVEPTHGALRPLAVDNVRFTEGFWSERRLLNRQEIIPHAVGWVDSLGWTANLVGARGGEYRHRGREFADSEIYKLIEAMSWDRGSGQHGLDDVLERLVGAVVGAQDADGYLHTLFGRPWQKPRYSDFQWGHELYCFGHLMQAAVAHYRSTGSDRLLAVAIRLADHVCTMFGAHGLDRVCGHAEIELGLSELFRVTGTARYRDQAALFVARRGTGTLPLFEFGAPVWQDDMPVRQASVLRGHAVRALYLAAGAVDVAIEANDTELLDALVVQWDNTVAARTYVTGGMGSHHMDEAFGEDFALPPDRSYCETCAGVASIMFSWRLLLATGEAKYADLIERTLYNVVATSPSADGRSFFYANTLHQRAAHTRPSLNDDGVVIRGGASGRQAWFEVSCCPPNVARMLASLGAYVATGSRQSIEIHQYAQGLIDVDGTVLDVVTDYPAGGLIQIVVREVIEPIAVTFRIPGWAGSATVTREGLSRGVVAGYCREELLRSGDTITIDLDMAIRRLHPDDRIDSLRGTVAFQRGPEVFALESVDLPPGWQLEDVVVTSVAPTFDETVIVEAARVDRRPRSVGLPFDEVTSIGPGATEGEEPGTPVRLVRYHEWAERGASTMRVWIPTGS